MTDDTPPPAEASAPPGAAPDAPPAPAPAPVVETGPPPLPWQHPTLSALAAAVGSTPRSLNTWIGQGAPIGPIAPYDELALRLWHAARAATQKAKPRPLSQATGDVARYCTLAREAMPAASTSTDPKQTTLSAADMLRRSQVKKVEQQLARGERAMERDAQRAFELLLGHMNKDLASELSGEILDDLYEACRKSRIPALRDLNRLLKQFVLTLIDKGLARIK